MCSLCTVVFLTRFLMKSDEKWFQLTATCICFFTVLLEISAQFDTIYLRIRRERGTAFHYIK